MHWLAKNPGMHNGQKSGQLKRTGLCSSINYDMMGLAGGNLKLQLYCSPLLSAGPQSEKFSHSLFLSSDHHHRSQRTGRLSNVPLGILSPSQTPLSGSFQLRKTQFGARDCQISQIFMYFPTRETIKHHPAAQALYH